MADKLLIVDREPFTLKALGRLLMHAEHEVILATGVAEALRELERPDIVLMMLDVDLPVEAGLGLARTAAEKYPRVALVVVTGIDDPRVSRCAHELGVYGYLTKPLNTSGILLTITNALRQRELEMLCGRWATPKG